MRVKFQSRKINPSPRKLTKHYFSKKWFLPYLGGLNLDFREFSDIGGRSDGLLYRFQVFRVIACSLPSEKYVNLDFLVKNVNK